MKSLLPLLALASIGLAEAQIQHYPEIEWKEKDSDHIMIRVNDTGPDPARRNAEPYD